MGTILGMIGAAVFIYGIITLIISFIKKLHKKKPIIIITAGFVAFIIGGALIDVNMTDEERAESKARSEKIAKESEDRKATTAKNKLEEKSDKEKSTKINDKGKVDGDRKTVGEKSKPNAKDKDKENPGEKEVEKPFSNLIEEHIKKRTDSEYRKTSISRVQVNEGVDGYYVQVFYKWDVNNRAKSTRSMTEMYSEDLAASMNKYEEVRELTVFWEVPYHTKGDNIAKYTFGRNNKGMYSDDVWYAPVIR